MFDKNKFALILKKINDTYPNQRYFSLKSKVNRTYLSMYINMKSEKPPKPIILKRLASASNGITSYRELLQVCGYLEYEEIINEEERMGKVFQLNDNYIAEEELTKSTEEILEILKKEKRTYSMNIFILQNVIKTLQNEVESIANTKIFQ